MTEQETDELVELGLVGAGDVALAPQQDRDVFRLDVRQQHRDDPGGRLTAELAAEDASVLRRNPLPLGGLADTGQEIAAVAQPLVYLAGNTVTGLDLLAVQPVREPPRHPRHRPTPTDPRRTPRRR